MAKNADKPEVAPTDEYHWFRKGKQVPFCGDTRPLDPSAARPSDDDCPVCQTCAQLREMELELRDAMGSLMRYFEDL